MMTERESRFAVTILILTALFLGTIGYHLDRLEIIEKLDSISERLDR